MAVRHRKLLHDLVSKHVGVRAVFFRSKRFAFLLLDRNVSYDDSSSVNFVFTTEASTLGGAIELRCESHGPWELAGSFYQYRTLTLPAYRELIVRAQTIVYSI